MTIEIEPEKEYFLKGNEQCKELLMRHKENQKWIYYVIIGSLSLITILNFMIPNFHWIKPDPINIKLGFVGVILVFFGSVFFFRAFIQSVAENWFDLYWWICVILTIVLFYFGLPILFG